MVMLKRYLLLAFFLFSLQRGYCQIPSIVFDPTAASNSAQQLAQLIDSKTQNSLFTAKNLELLSDGSLKMADMIGQLNDINDLYKKLNPFLQGSVTLKRVYEDYNQILATTNNLFTQAASANYINASQRDQLVSLASNILRRSGEDLSKIKEVLSTNFNMSDADRLKILADVETSLSKSITELNSGVYFANQLKSKYTKKVQDSITRISDSVLLAKINSEPIMAKSLVYVPSMAGYYDPTTGNLIPLDSNHSIEAIPSLQQMRDAYHIRATGGSTANISDYTIIFSSGGGSRQAEIIIGLFIVLNMFIGLFSLMGVKLIKSPGFDDNDNQIFVNKASTWFWSTLFFLFLFGVLRFLF